MGCMDHMGYKQTGAEMNFLGYTIHKRRSADSDGIIYTIVRDNTAQYVLVTLPVTYDAHQIYQEISEAIENFDYDRFWC